MATGSSRYTAPAAAETVAEPDPEIALRAAMLDAVGEALIATDLTGCIIHWNDAATRLYGWRADEVIGSNILDVTSAQGMAESADRIMNCLRAGHSWSGDFLVRHRDGREFPVLVTDAPLRNADGQVVGIVGISRDLSRQWEAEESAESAEQRLELMRRSTASAIWEWDLDSGAIRWSEATGDAFGYAPDAIEPTWEWWTSRIHPEDRARVTEGFRHLLEEEAPFWTEEYRFRTADRGYATVFDRVHVSRDPSGRPVRAVGTMLDVTERRQLHEGQRLLSQCNMILDLSLDFESTLPTIARLAAHALADYCILHVTAGEGFGGFSTAAHVDPRRQMVAEEAASFLSAGPPVGSPLERVLREGEALLLADGLPALVPGSADDPKVGDAAGCLSPRSALLVPLRARRSVVGFAVLGRTQSERPYDENDRHLAEELGRRIGLAVDHARLFQSAELANRAKSDFLAVISHELRTPLTAVLGYADLLGGEISGSLNPTQHRQVNRIRAGSDRLLRLIEGILTYARLEAGRERPQMAHASVRGLIDRTGEIVAPRAAEKGIGFRIELADVPDTIRTDPEKFVQVLLSLLMNAIKFTHEGDVRLRAAREDGLLLLDVSDSGNGIAPEHLPYVFNPFWQAEQPATRRAGGAGLGLSVARRLARLLHGDVVVTRSAPGGTTFRFQLPLHRGA